jgi:hypothetical protein
MAQPASPTATQLVALAQLTAYGSALTPLTWLFQVAPLFVVRRIVAAAPLLPTTTQVVVVAQLMPLR